MQESNADKRINHIWERVAIGLLGVVVLWGGTQFQDLKAQNKELENKVLFLYTDKVSQPQLKDTEDRLAKQIEAFKADVKSEIGTMKSDILARLDYVLEIKQKQR